jgi:putative FmdB family regulatory protein
MPFYEYECAAGCGHTEELFMDVSKIDEPVQCGKCGGNMKRVPSRLGRVEGAFTPIFYPNKQR